MKKYILIINPSSHGEEFYSYDSIAELLLLWGCDNLEQLKAKFTCIICESMVLF